MPGSYEEYEKACEQIRGENSKLLAGFEAWLSKIGLSAKVIKGHISNIDFYLNEYLLSEQPTTASEGADQIDMFLGYWFIKKAAWASPSSIKSNAASLKKFYAYMHERGLISKDALQSVHETIKENMSNWLATLERYDDPSITDPEDIWGL